jgi:hypothetical protein
MSRLRRVLTVVRLIALDIRDAWRRRRSAYGKLDRVVAEVREHDRRSFGGWN